MDVAIIPFEAKVN